MNKAKSDWAEFGRRVGKVGENARCAIDATGERDYLFTTYDDWSKQVRVPLEKIDAYMHESASLEPPRCYRVPLQEHLRAGQTVVFYFNTRTNSYEEK